MFILDYSPNHSVFSSCSCPNAFFLSERLYLPLSLNSLTLPMNSADLHRTACKKNVDEYIIWMSTALRSENCLKIKKGPIIYCKVLTYATINGLDSCHLLLDIIIFVRLRLVIFSMTCSYDNWGSPLAWWVSGFCINPIMPKRIITDTGWKIQSGKILKADMRSKTCFSGNICSNWKKSVKCQDLSVADVMTEINWSFAKPWFKTLATNFTFATLALHFIIWQALSLFEFSFLHFSFHYYFKNDKMIDSNARNKSTSDNQELNREITCSFVYCRFVINYSRMILSAIILSTTKIMRRFKWRHPTSFSSSTPPSAWSPSLLQYYWAPGQTALAAVRSWHSRLCCLCWVGRCYWL